MLTAGARLGGGPARAAPARAVYPAAWRLAHRARAAEARRRRRERSAAAPEAVTSADPLAAVSGRELCQILDDELNRLPARLRGPLVLCYLEGLTRDEAAARLGLS